MNLCSKEWQRYKNKWIIRIFAGKFNPMKCLTVVGARPQFIKAAVVSRTISQYTNIEEVIVHTGQHFDNCMSDIFFQEMSIPIPKYNLGICNLTHGAMTGQMLEGIEDILMKEQPDVVIVYGDTNSTLAGALAAKKLHIKVAHVEAGLRSFNMNMPEEINRILVDRISDWLFCPTNTAVNNLHNEGFDHFPCMVQQCGDVMYDAAMFYAPHAQKPAVEIPEKFILCTIHRAENTDSQENIKSILQGLEEIGAQIPIIIPLHPRTKNILHRLHFNFDQSPIHFIDPVGYFEMIYLLQHCALVVTDSGGVQKEAFFFQKNCVILREETEWVELVQQGYNAIAGTHPQNIVQTIQEFLDRKMDFSMPLYGDAHAGEKIVKTLLQA